MLENVSAAGAVGRCSTCWCLRGRISHHPGRNYGAAEQGHPCQYYPDVQAEVLSTNPAVPNQTLPFHTASYVFLYGVILILFCANVCFVMVCPMNLSFALISDMKQHYLRALSHHLKYVPNEAVLPEMPNVSCLHGEKSHVPIVFSPSATKSGRPYGVRSALLSLSLYKPPPTPNG